MPSSRCSPPPPRACLRAQEPIDLAPLRTAFVAANVARVGVALVGDDKPVVLAAGEVGGVVLSEQALVPLGTLARLMIADAFAVGAPDELDAIVCEVAGAKQTVRELLLGNGRLPDYWAFGPVASPPDRDALLACADFAAAGDLGLIQTRTSSAGARFGVAELVLLESRALGDGISWADFVRTRLAARGVAIDVRDVAELDPGRRAMFVGPTDELARSPAAALRLCMPVRDLAVWWRWREAAKLERWSAGSVERCTPTSSGQVRSIPLHAAIEQIARLQGR